MTRMPLIAHCAVYCGRVQCPFRAELTLRCPRQRGHTVPSQQHRPSIPLRPKQALDPDYHPYEFRAILLARVRSKT